MKITRKWAMANKWTFEITPIKELIKRYMGDSAPWVDPFAGMNSPAHIRNDINPTRNAEYHMDALEFMQTLEDESAAGVLNDPPFSTEQLKRAYADTFDMGVKNPTTTEYQAKMKRQVNRVLAPGGYVISLGWNTNGCSIARHRGGIKQFKQLEKVEVLIVAHGMVKNDTLVTVEHKSQDCLANHAKEK